MSRKGFFWGLAAGMAIMALLLVLAGGAIWGVRWASGKASNQTVLRFRIDPRELPEGLAPRGLPDRFGLRRFPTQPGLHHRGIGWAALCCGPVLLLIFGGLVAMACAGKHRIGLHCRLHDSFWVRRPPRGEEAEAEAEDETAAAEDSEVES